MEQNKYTGQTYEMQAKFPEPLSQGVLDAKTCNLRYLKDHVNIFRTPNEKKTNKANTSQHTDKEINERLILEHTKRTLSPVR